MPGDSLRINIKAKPQNTYDAIIVGSGISGGWAAKELCEKGLKVLLLERGRNVQHPDYPTATLSPLGISEPVELIRRRQTTKLYSEPALFLSRRQQTFLYQ